MTGLVLARVSSARPPRHRLLLLVCTSYVTNPSSSSTEGGGEAGKLVVAVLALVIIAIICDLVKSFIKTIKKTMLASTARSVARVASRRLQAPLAVRGFADKKDEGGLGEVFSSKPTIPFGIGKFLGEESDYKIPTDKQHKSKTAHMPDFIPDDIKKDMEDLGLDGIEDLDELEARNTEGYNDLGLVPPEGTGTFSSPILIPSRRGSRVVGYEDPDSHAMFWFTIHNDNSTYYIKDLGLFFKMLHIPDEAAAHH